MNNKYIIKVESPLLRAGLSITTEVSERYLIKGLIKLFKMIREFNSIDDKKNE